MADEDVVEEQLLLGLPHHPAKLLREAPGNGILIDFIVVNVKGYRFFCKSAGYRLDTYRTVDIFNFSHF